MSITGMVPAFLQPSHLAFRPKSSTLLSPAQRILFLMIWESLGAFWQTPSRLSCAFYWRVDSIWPLYHKGLIGGVLQRWGCPSGRFSLLRREICGSVRVTIGLLATNLTKALLPRLLMVVPNFFHKNEGGHGVLGNLQCCRNVLIPFSRSLPWHNLWTIPSTSWLYFCSDMHCQLWVRI